MYAIILQTSFQLAQEDAYKDVIDPYYSLVGYYNSIRELGGAVRLLQDDIPKRIYRIKTKYRMEKVRYLNKKVEITSRMSSYEIPKKLSQLEVTCDFKDCLDTAVATNMIAVGMDVDRLGLMVVTGQPSRIPSIFRPLAELVARTLVSCLPYIIHIVLAIFLIMRISLVTTLSYTDL